MPPPEHLGKTPLFYAAEARNAPAAKLLLEHGADVNVSTRFSQMSLLMAAVLSGVPQMVADLIKHGASLEDRDKYDQSARDYVAKLPKAQRPAMLRALGRA
ncbi:ankyrin repeat domain-containing protein [Chromobacterium haemolyticum]|uniref:ankyrin repeat domain-containing protein n=1 Tax=Chromobacterium TaxID=535 RepID=UPI004056FCFE